VSSTHGPLSPNIKLLVCKFCPGSTDIRLTNSYAESVPTSAVMPASQNVGGFGDERYPLLEEHGYRILGILGRGSYASVTLAFSERHQANVAVKIISKRYTHAEYLKKFLSREFSIVKMLKHPNIIVFLQVSYCISLAGAAGATSPLFTRGFQFYSNPCKRTLTVSSAYLLKHLAVCDRLVILFYDSFCVASHRL